MYFISQRATYMGVLPAAITHLQHIKHNDGLSELVEEKNSGFVHSASPR